MYTVQDVMTRNPVTLKETDDLALADSVFALGRVRHLPVVREGRLVGLLTHRDLLRYQAKAPAYTRRTVETRAAMQRRVLAAAPRTPLKKVLQGMLKKKYGCVPVIEGRSRKLVGIVTEADLVKFSLALLKEVETIERQFDRA